MLMKKRRTHREERNFIERDNNQILSETTFSNFITPHKFVIFVYFLIRFFLSFKKIKSLSKDTSIFVDYYFL